MPFITIDPLTIQVGDPLRRELFTVIKDDLDFLNTEVNGLSLGAKKVEIFKYLLLNGSNFSTATGLDYYQSIDTFTITSAVIRIFELNSLGGSLQIDVKRSTTNMDSPSFTSIFTTKPSVNFTTAVAYESSTNQVFDAGQISIVPGDILRLDITGMPTGGVMPKVQLIIYGES